MRRESVPQGMRREFLLDAGFLGIALDDVPERLARHAVAAAGREQVVGLPFQQYFDSRSLHELLQPLHRFVAERYQTFAIALADHAHHALIEIDLIVLEPPEFGDPPSPGLHPF